MNIKQAKEEITNTIKAYLTKDSVGEYKIPIRHQRPILLIGPPGIGKTAVMEQAARELKIALCAYTITHHTRQSAVGLPYIEKKMFGDREYSVTEYTMSEIIASVYETMEQTGLREGILFIDEINCVSETLAPTMLQFLQFKTFGTHKVPEGWVIAAAGNPPQYNKSVREFDIATMDRVKKIEVESEFDVWKEYAYKESIHGTILSYLKIKNENLCTMKTTLDGICFATPRGWEDLSQLIGVYEELGIDITRDLVGEYIQHPDIASDFIHYYFLYQQYKEEYKIDEILNGHSVPNSTKLADAPLDVRFSMVHLLIDRLGRDFKDLAITELYMDEWFGILKNVLSKLDMKEQNAEAILAESYQERYQRYEKQRKDQTIGEKEKHTASFVLRSLENYRNKIKEAGPNNSKKAGERIRTWFQEENKKREEKIEELSKQLDYAFDFILKVFGSGAELVLFLSELNANEYSSRYLIHHGNHTYYRYNKELLFDDQEQKLRTKINEFRQQEPIG